MNPLTNAIVGCPPKEEMGSALIDTESTHGKLLGFKVMGCEEKFLVCIHAVRRENGHLGNITFYFWGHTPDFVHDVEGECDPKNQTGWIESNALYASYNHRN